MCDAWLSRLSKSDPIVGLYVFMKKRSSDCPVVVNGSQQSKVLEAIGIAMARIPFVFKQSSQSVRN